MAERPTPYSISVCTLIALHSDPSSPLHHELELDDRTHTDLSALLQECVVVASTSAWSSVHATPLVDFMAQLERVGGPRLRKLVLDYVAMAAASIDALMDLMESLRRAIGEGVVDGASAHGIYLRQVCLGFDQLSFETTSLLWTDLCDEMKQLRNHDDNNDMMEAGENKQAQDEDSMTNRDDHLRWPLSAVQLERSLRKECYGFEEVSHQDSNSFEHTELHLRQVLQHNPELPAAHFLRFLNCIKHGERVGALGALHQYFDYAIIQSRRRSSSYDPGSDISKTTTPEHDILQFAAILLANLHHSFGDHALAQMATDEAVRVAQQSMDAACVAFALGWIFSNEHRTSNGGISGGMGGGGLLDSGELLRRCASRAIEGQLRPLAAGANLSLSKFHLSGGQNATAGHSGGEGNDGESRGCAAAAWTSLMDATTDRPNLNDDGTIDRPTHMTDIPSSRDLMGILARQSLVGAGIWDYFGQTQLSGLSSFLALYCHADQMLSSDVGTAIQNIARVSLCGSPSVLLSRDFDGSALQTHLESIMEESEIDHADSTEPSTSCIYADSLQKLTSMWKLFRLPTDGVFLLGVTLILHEWAIRRGELRQAAAFGVALESFLNPCLHNYSEVMIDVFSQKCLLLSRQGKWAEAKRLAKRMIGVAKKNNLQTHHASLLLELAMIQLDSNPHMFRAVLPPLLECLTMTDKCMDGLHSTALSVLAQVHLRMRNPKRAIALLEAALPSLLQREHAFFQGEAFLTLAKSRLQLAKEVVRPSTGDSQKQDAAPIQQQQQQKKKTILTSLLRSASNDLHRSEEFFLRCQDCLKLREVYYLQARVNDSIPGEQERRDKASEEFLKVSKHLTMSDRPLAKGVMDCVSDMNKLEEMASRKILVS